MESWTELFAVVLIFLLAHKLFFLLSRKEFNELKRKGRHPLWKSLRDQHIQKNPFCAVCGKFENLAVHHKLPVSKFPEKELDRENLVTLCQNNIFNCHFVVGHLMDWNTYNPNVDNDINFWKDKLSRRFHKKSFIQFFRW